VSDQYYTPQEFESIGPEGRAKVYRLRKERDKQRQVSSLSEGDITRIVAALDARPTTNDENNPAAANQMVVEADASNQTNPALFRANRK
jgi:hypothetical protein